MKINSVFFLSALITLFFSAAGECFAQFTLGNVIVLQTGDGSAALGSTATAVFLKEYNTTTAGQTSAISSVTIPVTGTAQLTQSGTATSEGQITLSADSTKIVVAGYDATAGVAGIASTASATTARVIDTVNAYSVVGRAASTNSQFSANNLRCAARSAADNYWGAGGNSGTYYFGNTAVAANVQSTSTNTRVINTFNGNLYFSSSSGTASIYKIIGQPTATAIATALFATGTGSSPYGFAANAAETVFYVADDRTTTGGGIQKWVNSGGWGTTPAYTLSVGTSQGARGIAVDFSGTYPTIYATTTDNRLIKIVDSNATAAVITLATAGTNLAFRSVAFAPKIACTAPSLSTTVTNISCTGNGAITVLTTGGTGPFTYSWAGPGGFSANTQNISNLTVAGSYTVTVTTPGNCITTTNATVTSSVSLTATITPAGATTFCQGGNVVLNANTGTGYTYQWNVGGSPISGATSASCTASISGNYTVTITSSSCTITSTIVVVTANPLPTATITSGATTFCQGDSVVLHASAGTNYTYQWKLGTAAVPGAIAANYTATASGSYTVTITNSSTTCSANSTAIIVTVNPLPITTVTPSGPTTFCEGDSVLLKAVSDNSYTYQWSVNGFDIIGAVDSQYLVNISGNYSIVITTANNCIDSSNTTVTVHPLPLPMITNTNHILSTGTFTGYTWYLNGAAISGANAQNYTVTQNGIYFVAVTDANGCSNISDTIVITDLAVHNIIWNGEQIKIYPNPATNTIYLQLPALFEVVITDVQGRKIIELVADKHTQPVNISTLNNGLYFVNFYNNKKIIGTEKLIIARD